LRFTVTALLFLLITCFAKGQTWRVYEDSGKALQARQQYKIALINFREARQLLPKDSSVSLPYARLSNSIADALRLTSKFDSALIELEQTRDLLNRIAREPSPEMAVNLRITGTCLYMKGNYERSELYFIKSLQLRKQVYGTKHLQYAIGCTDLGNLYNQQGDYKKAEPLYMEALEAITPQEEQREYARICNNLADLYRAMGEFEKAEPLALKAKELRGKITGKNTEAYAISCTNLANLYRDLGQFKKAEENYLEAKSVRGALGKNKFYGEACNILADLYVLMGEYRKAETLYKEALEVRASDLGKEHRDYAQTLNNLGSLYINTGDYQAAEQRLVEAQSIWSRTLDKNHTAIFINKHLLASLYSATGEYNKAMKLFDDVLDYWKKNRGENHPEYLQSLNGLARLYWRTNEIKRAADLYEKVFRSTYDQIAKVFRFTNEAEKQQYLDNIKAQTDEIYSFFFSSNLKDKAGLAYNISLLNRNLILTSSQQLRQKINDSHDTSLLRQYDKWIATRQELARFYSREGSEKKIDELEDVANTLEKELTRKSAAFKSDRQDREWKAIRKDLSHGELSIEFASFNYFNSLRWCDSNYYVAFLLSKTEEPKMVYLFEERQLDSLLSAVGKFKSITKFYTRGIDDEESNITSTARISDLVWKPLAAHVKRMQKIYFAPAGNLFKISFAALPIEPDKVVSDLHQLVQLNTTASVGRELDVTINEADRVLLYGGIVYDQTTSAKQRPRQKPSMHADMNRGGEFDYLKGTLQEIRVIERKALQKKIPAAILTGLRGTERSFKQLNGNASPAILHIATHGFFFPDPKTNNRENVREEGKMFQHAKNPLLRSGLVFAQGNQGWKGLLQKAPEDGILTAYEVAAGIHLPNTKLVVLSACETGLGDIKGSEGVYGLQRAFAMAGVKKLMMSLWEVPDLETSEFMQAFYSRLFDGEPITAAFNKAQTILRNKYRNDPFKWAAWILVQ
jgi:CHAT domain-containing protein/Flp pilus assembly protein TadD